MTCPTCQGNPENIAIKCNIHTAPYCRNCVDGVVNKCKWCTQKGDESCRSCKGFLIICPKCANYNLPGGITSEEYTDRYEKLTEIKCNLCNGTGLRDECWFCKGSGKNICEKCKNDESCWNCDKTGYQIKDGVYTECWMCKGKGKDTCMKCGSKGTIIVPV